MANWIESFAKKERIAASLCVAFAHHPSGMIRNKADKPKGLTKLE